MSFQFGSSIQLDPTISLYSLLCVVAFVLFFDYLSCMVEYFLGNSKLHQAMLHSIYREIMLMGLLAFASMTYKAAVSNNDPGDDSIDGQIFNSLDFATMLMFWITIFLVLHTFYFLLLTQWNDHHYHQYNTEDILELTSKIELYSKYKNWKMLFESPYWPFSRLRHRVEFYLLRDLFQNLYLLPMQFDYGTYLSLSYGKFCSRVINRSSLAWLFLIVVLLVNFFRIMAGFSCGVGGDDDIIRDPSFHTKINCNNYSIRVFLFAGIVMAFYFGLLVLITHLYKQR